MLCITPSLPPHSVCLLNTCTSKNTMTDAWQPSQTLQWDDHSKCKSPSGPIDRIWLNKGLRWYTEAFEEEGWSGIEPRFATRLRRLYQRLENLTCVDREIQTPLEEAQASYIWRTFIKQAWELQQHRVDTLNEFNALSELVALIQEQENGLKLGTKAKASLSQSTPKTKASVGCSLQRKAALEVTEAMRALNMTLAPAFETLDPSVALAFLHLHKVSAQSEVDYGSPSLSTRAIPWVEAFHGGVPANMDFRSVYVEEYEASVLDYIDAVDRLAPNPINQYVVYPCEPDSRSLPRSQQLSNDDSRRADRSGLRPTSSTPGPAAHSRRQIALEDPVPRPPRSLSKVPGGVEDILTNCYNAWDASLALNIGLLMGRASFTLIQQAVTEGMGTSGSFVEHIAQEGSPASQAAAAFLRDMNYVIDNS
ncbi:hypothetical protein FRB90_006478 [Tulasnella sp. 427]|nr:hypothetical protein FRB90_006478 [Tulasnella sp. 427]